MRRVEVLILSIGIFLTILAWSIADVYHAYMTKQAKVKISDRLVNANYSINLNVLKELEKRVQK